MIDEDVGATTEQIDRQAPFGDRVLLVIDGASLQVVPLPGTGTLTIGRSQKCDVAIDSGRFRVTTQTSWSAKTS